jgi:hypothetical protein
MVGLLRHSQRKRGGNGLARPTATALRLDSTEVAFWNGREVGGIELWSDSRIGWAGHWAGKSRHLPA